MTDTVATHGGAQSAAASATGPSLAVVNDPSARLRLDVSYDGTEFAGWAAQPDQRTVQAVLQDALGAVLRLAEVSLTVAGRTDSGVHADAQVAHLDVPTALWAQEGESLLRRLAGILPPDLRVLGVREVAPQFDARFGALWRRYEYRISDVGVGVAPLRRRFVLDHRRSLDVAAMASAAEGLEGLNDYAAFCKRRDGATTRRCVQSFTVEREPVGPGLGEVVIRIQADAFCHSMVRSLVGALIAVGEGRRSVDWAVSLLSASERANDVMVAGPHGLRLTEVGYPPDHELAARAEQTRARRD